MVGVMGMLWQRGKASTWSSPNWSTSSVMPGRRPLSCSVAVRPREAGGRYL